ncbi:MAG TPA: hypothetical protein DCY74_05025 [Clostridiales bacterium]|jgi:hypothetical protein|nr:hypothetical protein [Clostridiales bacterium]HBE13513.1 hypothetical protein [Clostridiales bacterium]HCG35911.1 hypothetical protein [Clostridiales bacterium]
MQEITRYDFKKKPKKSNFLMYPLKWIAAYPYLWTRGFKCKKVNMEGLKPPYLLLCNHGSTMDYRMMFRSIAPYNPNYVVALDGIRDNGEFIMRLFGTIGKRKFIHDLSLIRNLKYCVNELKTIVCIYPEARYSFDGTTSYLPDSLGSLARMLGVPVVVLNMRGNFLSCPQWNKIHKKVPLEATLTQIATAEEVKNLPAGEINMWIHQALIYDDFRYQQDNHIRIAHPQRAFGLNRLLYQCAHCGTEYQMNAQGIHLWCDACNKKWELTEYGELKALEGETIFSHIPDWYRWERQNVRNEVRNGTYRFEREVDVETLPNAKRFYKQGIGKLLHTVEVLRLECMAYGKKKLLELSPQALESVHIEYDYKKLGDSLDISEHDDSFWIHPKNVKDVITKIALATEEIHAFALENSPKLRRTKA